MASNSQNSTRFFSALRHLARELDDGITTLQQRVQPEKQAAGDSQARHVTAMKLSLGWKKELEALTKSGREVLTEMRDRNIVFERSVQLAEEIMERNQNYIAQIQTYLQQYGYCLTAEETNSSAEEDGGSVSKMELTEDDHLNIVKEDPPHPDKLSPRLEDFGISSYTLSMLTQPKVASVQHNTNCLQSTQSQMEGGCIRHDSVPTPFQTKGLMVTPSLFPNCHCSICKTDASEYFPSSPACSVFNKIDHRPLWGQVQEGKCSPDKQELAKTLEFTDSPLPPVLNTPAIKQIPPLKELFSESKVKQMVPEECLSPEPPVLMTPGIQQIPSMKEFVQQQTSAASCHRNKVARQLKLDTGLVDSPVPPILRTPGIGQIMDGNSIVDKTGKQSVMYTCSSSIVCQDLEMPRSPQLTYSLKDLEEMTESFRNSSLTDTLSHKYVMWGDGKIRSQLTDDKSCPEIKKTHNNGALTRPGNLTLPIRPHLQSFNSSYLMKNSEILSRHGNLTVPKMHSLQSFSSSYLSECPPEPHFASSGIDQYSLPPVPEFKSFNVNGSYLEPHSTGNTKRHMQEDKTAMMEGGLNSTLLNTQKCDQKKRGPRSEADWSRFGFRPEGEKTVLIQKQSQNCASPSKESRGIDAAGGVILKEGGFSITAGLTCHSVLKSVDSKDSNKENNPYSYSHKTQFGTQR